MCTAGSPTISSSYRWNEILSRELGVEGRESRVRGQDSGAESTMAQELGVKEKEMPGTVKIITDSTSDIPAYLAGELDIGIVPLTINFGSKTYIDGKDITVNEFYEKLLSVHELPTTASPSPGQFSEEYTKAEQDGRDILSIHISAKLSGVINVALQAREKIKARVEVLDSRSATMGLGLQAIWAAKKSREGMGLDRLIEELKRVQTRTKVLGMVDTLEYLHRGGRIGIAQAFLGSLLSMKPILGIQNGETFPLERVRTRTKALFRVWELCQADSPFEELAILYSTSPEDAEEMLNKFAAIYPREKIYKARFGPIMGTHIGPGSLGVAYIVQGREIRA